MPDSLSGSVERITFYNPDNGYSVLRIRPDEDALSQDAEGLVTISGNLPELTVGEHLQLGGDWVKHPKYGLQFNVQSMEQVMPVTVEGISRYLSSGILKGVGPTIAKRIVDHFGVKAIEIIDKQPDRLREVADIGPKRQKQILAAWDEQRQVRSVMLFLNSHGVSSNLATKIHKQYGTRALEVVQRDPYRLARDMHGVGFKTADRIAQSLGLPADHPTRLEAGLAYTLDEFAGEGNVYAPRPQLLQRAAELLGVPRPALEAAISPLAESGDVVIEGEAIYPRALHAAELGVAEKLRGLIDATESALADLPELKGGFDLGTGAQLGEQQQGALKLAFQNRVSVLTGGPGTGKTTAMKALIATLKAANKRFALASPTGRAAKRLSQAAEHEASTIHRLVGFTPGEGPKFNEENPLKIDFLVVDEASMLDLLLTHTLLRAVKPGTHVLFVGDVDQLPSVGAGDVLRDLIASGQVPITRLETIYRQGENSQIVSNAHNINHGELPITSKDTDGDFFVDPAETGQEAAEKIVALVSERIPGRFKFDPMLDIQVLTPIYRGPAGVLALNEAMQQKLNPATALKPERRFFGQLMRAGDRLMQIKNNYDKSVFNGDIGLLREISNENQSLSVDFEGRLVEYDWNEADELTLAYAVTVHKSQGSEFPVVVMPVLAQHFVMLQRNLVYTGVTRAKKLCVLVGSRKAIAIAVKNNKVSERWSGLAARLKGN